MQSEQHMGGILECLNVSSPDVGPTWGWIRLPTRTKETETEHMFPHFHASRTRRTVWKDLEIMEANENKQKVSGFYCIDQLNLLKYCGFKVNGRVQVQLISVWLTFAYDSLTLRAVLASGLEKPLLAG